MTSAAGDAFRPFEPPQGSHCSRQGESPSETGQAFQPRRIDQTFADGANRLRAAGIDDASLEAEVLLRNVLSPSTLRAASGEPGSGGALSREAFLQRLREPIGGEATCRFDAALGRRLRHEPTAYITGRREFFGLEFEVGPAVLIPRPETELLVEAAIELARPRSRIRRGPILADIGTGSGAVAVAIAHSLPRAEVYGVDISQSALSVAAANARRYGIDARVSFWRGDLLSPLPEFVDVLVANLPYVTTADWQALAPEVRDFEPHAALDGGPDGLDVIRRFLADAPSFLRPGGAICLEFGAGQTLALLEAARRCFTGYRLEVRRDLAGRDRVLVITPT